jgi:RimJ/RimL family protein N-acetyltransferase
MSTIETSRLRLRPHRIEDYEAYLPIWTQPDPNPSAFSLDAENVWYRLLRWIGHWTHFGYGLFVIEDLATGALLGEVGCAHFRRSLGERFDDAPEAAWRIVLERRGSGIASEAMRAALEWFDRTQGTQRIACMIDPNNGASLKVAARLGFAEYDRAVYRGEPVILLERPRAP